jgi:hypothetical protein
VNITTSDAIMQEEVKRAIYLTAHEASQAWVYVLSWALDFYFQIFGPVLPIISVEDTDEAIAFINSRYAFKTVLLKSAVFTYSFDFGKYTLSYGVFSFTERSRLLFMYSQTIKKQSRRL